MAHRRHCSPLRKPDGSGKMRFVTDGRRILSTFTTEQRAELAKTCGISEAAVSSWACGSARPDYEFALVLEVRFGVPMRSWASPPFSNPICPNPGQAPRVQCSTTP